MKYILSDNIALRSWDLVPYACYVKGVRNARGLKKEEYELLRLCDGQRETENSALLQSLVSRGFCRPARDGETLTPWQREKICGNRYFPAMNWMITGKCNYNCLHCFNAADNSRLQSEFTLEEAEKLIGEAEKCGINAFTITGGEPMIHPHFTEIIRGIYARGMYVEELNTNGFFLTQEILDEMKEIGFRPLMKISFDGIGHHDWLRNRKGAEEDALRAIRLCTENGFRVKAQTNVHRLNVGSILPTAELLSDMGVCEMRVIRTTEAPRWLQNAGDACLTLEEYFDSMLTFLIEYACSGRKMTVDIWQFVHLYPESKTFRPRAFECGEGGYRDSLPVCRGNRGMAAVGANGNLYPCHQMSGYYEQHGRILGNVKTDGLQPLLRDSNYLNSVCATVKDLKEHNEKCAACKWFRYCCGGCRAIGLALTGDVFGQDLSKCLFFEGGYIEKLKEVLPGFEMIPKVPEKLL
ncbi:MAG: radical SAM protein [Firmicutes bacterium]|nr:radical SAM protein [Candidatus Colimorpha enterica]